MGNSSCKIFKIINYLLATAFLRSLRFSVLLLTAKASVTISSTFPLCYYIIKVCAGVVAAWELLLVLSSERVATVRCSVSRL